MMNDFEAPARRCAIYTRKSVEDGVTQEFNSLHAQHDACSAYVTSQAGEGWHVIPETYDDGGYSGGNTARPSFQRLLQDIESGKIDIVLVYKVDRLTRNLSDFSKIMDVFDQKKVSFVSVTQAFNTTNSMGRLTLNMLLSFAQFEREIAGERVRDKIAASKARGIWMGGNVPFGYRLNKRRLYVSSEEAEQVRQIFDTYAEVKSMTQLRARLAASGIGRRRLPGLKTERGATTNFSATGLYHLLKNRIYLGEICHNGTSYPGQHDAIVEVEKFKLVARQLQDNKTRLVTGANTLFPSPLVGIIWDEHGRRMFSSNSTKQGKVHRYYTSQPDKDRRDLPVLRVSAEKLECLIFTHLPEGMAARWPDGSPDRMQIRTVVRRIVIETANILLTVFDTDQAEKTISIPARWLRRGDERQIVSKEGVQSPKPNHALVRLIVDGHIAKHHLAIYGSVADSAEMMGLNEQDFARVLQRGYLAPDITAAILDGRQPKDLTVERLAYCDLSAMWHEQRKSLGFQSPEEVLQIPLEACGIGMTGGLK
ncbi:recombinase family protein [Sphingobium sp. CECT 9361]|uniref:recombinase family protein n=1 Tax=Sphingobium sp. CECT 9361 TaxID=2845384 RepID=UPI001E3B1E4E|nr:recombinase family protein [Sphingobium sp. CECT 9361]CAH0356888.1 hypothetical protein SPH9361_04534 [Sphingobium sp. CECT 9361]